MFKSACALLFLLGIAACVEVSDRVVATRPDETIIPLPAHVPCGPDSVKICPAPEEETASDNTAPLENLPSCTSSNPAECPVSRTEPAPAPDLSPAGPSTKPHDLGERPK